MQGFGIDRIALITEKDKFSCYSVINGKEST
jgi:hypothetical protein